MGVNNSVVWRFDCQLKPWYAASKAHQQTLFNCLDFFFLGHTILWLQHKTSLFIARSFLIIRWRSVVFFPVKVLVCPYLFGWKLPERTFPTWFFSEGSTNAGRVHCSMPQPRVMWDMRRPMLEPVALSRHQTGWVISCGERNGGKMGFFQDV